MSVGVQKTLVYFKTYIQYCMLRCTYVCQYLLCNAKLSVKAWHKVKYTSICIARRRKYL